jgi:hypothetical protein
MVRVHPSNQAGKRPQSKAEAWPWSGLAGRRTAGIVEAMSESIAPAPIQPPAEGCLSAGAKTGVIGLFLGLLGAGLLIIPQQRPANAVNKVFVEARAVVLTARVERGNWPLDGELSALAAAGKASRLRALLADCPLPGGWRFVSGKAQGGPAIVFTPAETGQAYERCLRLVDAWIDDGDPATGDLIVGPDRARLRLSAE